MPIYETGPLWPGYFKPFASHESGDNAAVGLVQVGYINVSKLDANNRTKG